MTKHHNSSTLISDMLSRRDLIRAGALLLPATAVAPALFTRVSQAATTSSAFNYYISTTGSDSNPGTLTSPWAITAINTKQSTYAGTRLGILPGTYDVSGLMGTFHSPALQINGGPNSSTPTYIGTSNSSGQYQVGTATLDSKGSSGFYGGGNANNCTVIGTATGESGGPGTPANWGNWILDGIQITGFSAWALQVGSYDGTGGPVPNCTLQNATIANSNGAPHGGAGAHTGPLQLYAYTKCLISNCYFSSNVNSSQDSSHFAGITVWGGIGGGSSSGLTVQLCTFLTTGGIYGIYDEGVISGTTVQQCYFDMSTSGSGTGVQNSTAIQGFGNTAAGGLAGSVFRNNICKGGQFLDGYYLTAADQWATTATYYNNTIDLDGGAASPGIGMRMVEAAGHTGIFSCYNNLCYDNGFTGSMEYGYNSCNSDGFAVCDYNIYGTRNTFTVYGTNGSGSTPGAGVSFSSWKTAIGRDAHSSASSVNPFTNNGSYALGYNVKAGSPAYQTGRVGGVASGAVCNIGAWDGIVAQIGSNLAGGLAVPNAPALKVS
jgi:hypothetical protein